MTKVINGDEFSKLVLESSQPVLVDFFAVWCGPCQQMTPVLEELQSLHSDWTVYKVDVDECPEIAQEYQVSSIPTLIVFSDGKIQAQTTGLQSVESLEKLVQGMA